MAYGACAIDGRCPRMDGRAFGFSGVGKGLNSIRVKRKRRNDVTKLGKASNLM